MITNKQRGILEVIHKYIQANGISPTVRNICNLAGLKSSSTVHSYLTALEQEGYISKIEGSPRSITITEKGMELIN